jgi:hypothetical protein
MRWKSGRSRLTSALSVNSSSGRLQHREQHGDSDRATTSPRDSGHDGAEHEHGDRRGEEGQALEDLVGDHCAVAFDEVLDRCVPLQEQPASVEPSGDGHRDEQDAEAEEDGSPVSEEARGGQGRIAVKAETFVTAQVLRRERHRCRRHCRQGVWLLRHEWPILVPVSL